MGSSFTIIASFLAKIDDFVHDIPPGSKVLQRRDNGEGVGTSRRVVGVLGASDFNIDGHGN